MRRATDMGRKAINKIKELEGRKAELQAKITQAPQDGERVMKLVDLLTMIDNRLPEFPPDLLQDLVNLAVIDAELSLLSSHFVLLRVKWRSVWEAQDIVIFRRNPAPKRLTDEEKARLKETYPSLSPDQIGKAFPSHSWAGLRSTAMKRFGCAYKSSIGLTYSESLSVEDCQIMEGYNIKAGECVSKSGKEPYIHLPRPLANNSQKEKSIE